MDPSHPDRVLVAIRQIVRAIDLHSRQLIQEHGLTVPQLLVLKEVLRAGCPTVGEVAAAIHLSQGTVTQILIRLEQRGLLTRERSAQDKRKVQLGVTEHGIRILDKAPLPLHDRFLSSYGSLPEWEQTLLLSALQRVADLMGAGKIDAAPLLTPGEIRDGGITDNKGEQLRGTT